MVAPRRGRLRFNDTDRRHLLRGPDCMVAGMSDSLKRLDTMADDLKRIGMNPGLMEEAAARIRELEASNLDARQLGYDWMVAHDSLHAGKPYKFPSPVAPTELASLRKRVSELEASNATAFAAGVEAAAKNIENLIAYLNIEQFLLVLKDNPHAAEIAEAVMGLLRSQVTAIRALSPPTGMVMVSPNQQQETKAMNDKMIKHMVDRFLGWKLPADFAPDGGIRFEAYPDFLESWKRNEFNRRNPSGTNLLNAEQAEAMVRYLVEDAPTPSIPKVQP